MEITQTLLHWLGLGPAKVPEPQSFDLRLTRLSIRETRRNVRTPLFVRRALSHPAGAMRA